MTLGPRTTSVNLDLDFGKLSKRIQDFVSSYISKVSANGLIIGLSGGLDSSVVLKLAVNALSPTRVVGIVMPSDTTPEFDTDQAIDLAESLHIEYHVIDINPLLAKYAEAVSDNKIARGNLMARIRMGILYFYANVNGYLVAGTSDKSEYYIGYFTKFGDGAADMLPIADLYKTQVRALGKFLGIPSAIIEKKSSPRLWEDHLAEEEIGMDYGFIDSILYLLIDKKMKPRNVANKIGIPTNQVNKIRDMMKKSAHKRNTPPIARLKS